MKTYTKCCLAIAGIFATAMVSLITTDRVKEHKEKKKFTAYGFPVETEYGNMRAVNAGEKGPQIVILNGYGSASPYLEFKPLMKSLSRFPESLSLNL